MKVSIIVAVFNRENFIGACVESLLKQSIEDYEVIIVDDGSSDRTVEILRNFQASNLKVLINETNKGKTYSLNKGLREAQGRFIAITDSDCVADSDWIRELTKPFEMDEQIMITGGRIIDPPPKTYWEMVNKGINFVADKSCYVKEIVGCNMAFRKEFLDEHRFDENIKCAAADELDLCFQCLKEEKKIYYHDTAIVTHFHRSTLIGTLKQQFNYGFMNVQVAIKNGSWSFFLNYLFWAIIIILMIVSWQIYFSHFSFWILFIWGVFFYCLGVAYFSLKPSVKTWREYGVSLPGQILCHMAHSLGRAISLTYRILIFHGFFKKIKQFYSKMKVCQNNQKSQYNLFLRLVGRSLFSPKYCIGKFYICNLYYEKEKHVYTDTEEAAAQYQIRVYEFARNIIVRDHLESVVDIGCGLGIKLKDYIYPVCQHITGIDTIETISKCRQKYHWGIWIDDNIEFPLYRPQKSFDCIICSDIIEHLFNPDRLFDYIEPLMDRKTRVILSTPERDNKRGEDDCGPPDNPAHVREWNFEEFRDYIRSKNLTIKEHFTVEDKKGRNNHACQVLLCMKSTT